MYVVTQIALVLLVLSVTQGILRRASRWVLWTLFGVLPLALTPYWLQINDFGPFVWIKCYSIFFCLCWGSLLRDTTLGAKKWARATIPLLLAANILEATVVDWLEGGIPHMLNGIAGLFLLASLPYGWRRTLVTSTSQRDLYCGTNRGWFVGYTLWNWTFVVLNFPQYAGYHTAVLLAALLVGWREPQRWLQTRAFTLGTMLFGMVTCDNELLAWLDTTTWADASMTSLAACVTTVYIIGYVASAASARWLQTPKFKLEVMHV